MRPATLPGDQLGNFEVVAPLAEGGMARLFLARVAGIGAFERYIVLKLLSAEMQASSDGIAMFLEEARVLAALNHQNIAQILGIGRDDDRHFLAMEFVHGRDARQVLVHAATVRQRLPYEFGAAVVARVAAGLDHAHRRCGPDGTPLGIVHRDVSPSNVMIGYDGGIKIIDFGIAKSTAARRETQAGTIKGKYAYMSPEQARARPIDARSDVFALGILLYELTTQRPCFRADADFDTLLLVTGGKYAAPESVVADYPPGLAAIVARALHVEPEDRFQSAGELLEALEALAATEGWVLSATRVAATMRALFGDVPEPWDARVPGADAARAMLATTEPRPAGEVSTTSPTLDDDGPTPTPTPSWPRLATPTTDPQGRASPPPGASSALIDTLPEPGAPAVVTGDAPPLRRTTLPELILFGFANTDGAAPDASRSGTTGSLPVVRFAGAPRTTGSMRVVNVTTMAPVTPVVPRPIGATSMPAPARGRRGLLIAGGVALLLLVAGVVWLVALR